MLGIPVLRIVADTLLSVGLAARGVSWVGGAVALGSARSTLADLASQ